MVDPSAHSNAGATWVGEHRAIVDLAVGEYLRTGKWPSKGELQRDANRANIRDDVERAADTMPRLPGQPQAESNDTFLIPLHVLRSVHSASDLVAACLGVLWRLIRVYNSDANDPRLDSSDPVLARLGTPFLVRLAVEVIRSSEPHPFGDGDITDIGWNFRIDYRMAPRLVDDIQSIDDYVQRQVDVLRDAAVVQNAQAEPKLSSFRIKDIPAGWAAIIAAIIGALILGYFTLRAANKDSKSPPTPSNSNSSSQPSPSSHGNSASQSSSPALVDQSWLTGANFCSWRFGTNPVPLVSRQPVTLRIDDRCNFPQHPDPATDVPTKVYAEASQTSRAVGEIVDGTLITVRCYETRGEFVEDAVHNKSNIWLGIQSPRGLIPDVNVGGGYTVEQLSAWKVPRC